MLAQKHKRNLRKIISFGIIWAAFGLLYVLLEYGILGDSEFYPSTKNRYSFTYAILFTPTTALIAGLLFGIVEVYFLNQVFREKKFWQKILFKTTIYLIAILAFLFATSFLMNSLQLDAMPYEQVVIDSIVQFVGNFVFWTIIVFLGAITLICLFVSEVMDYLGIDAFNNFFAGKYHRPKEEDRIFMFLDMRSSTSIAEELGHVKFFELLNAYYADTTDAIIETSGEVYQYVGDEVVLTWELKEGAANKALECFFKMKAALKAKGNEYMDRYGLIPDFKAGIHHGSVTTGEIGRIRKEIVFTGDVLNTAARIQGLCNAYGVQLLMSKDFMASLSHDESLLLKSVGEAELRGRNQKINLYSAELAIPKTQR